MEKNKFIYTVLIFLFFLPLSGFSQSRYLEDGIGGPGFELSLGLVDYELTTFGIGAAYSIGGIMDIGVYMAREEATLAIYDSTELDLGFNYNLIVVKQTKYVPFNLQLEGSYGYTNVSSDYLTNTSQERFGQGFKLGSSIYSEISIIPYFGIIIGGKGLYSNYIFTQTAIDNERIEELEFGFLSAISMKIDNWPIISLGVEVLYSVQEPGISVEPSISFINPSY